MTAVTTNGYINSLDVPLLISAEGATRMKIGESQTALDAATWIAFAASHTHTLASATNGTRKLMVAFADDAGNTYGLGGEIQASFILDTISPADGVISLLPPESPTGAFNTPLAWLADYGEPMSYAIEVSSSAAFASILRTMESTQANTVINPPLETEGTYYWRVRAIDAAGNQSSWVPSGAKNSFKVVIMAQSYQAQFNVNGTPGSDTMFGKSILSVGDLNNDGVSEIAISVPGSGDGGCTDCGAVKIFNPASRSYMTTFASGLPNTAAFGHKMITCDVNGDGNKELIVSAPAKKVVKDGVTYNNVGGIYAYNLQNKSLLASFEPALPAVDGSGLMPGYMWCSSWNYSGSCPEYGWSYWPEATPSVPWGDGIYFGWDLTCLENNSGPSQLAVGSPNYSSSNNYAAGYREGRVDILGYAGGVFSKQSSLTNGNQAEESFGAAVVYLNQFKITADTNCDSVGETLAIGAPRRYISGQEMGAVDLYQKIGGTWTKCSTSFFSDPAKSEPSWSYFGSRLFNLGNFDKDGEGIQELAIATTAWSGGLIKFYNGGAAEVKSFYTNSSNLSRFGYQIKPAGDFNSDNQAELAIGVPGAYVNGKWSSGQVSIYQWSDLDLDDDADDSGMTPVTPLLQIQGKPEDGSALGADFIPILQSASIHSAFSSIFASRPSLSIGGMWSVGSIGNYAKIKMAPTSPYRVVGTNSGARFGTSMTAPGKDFDNDNVSDFIIGQPGGRCDGRPYGAVSLYSVLDKQVTYSICASPTDTWSSNYIESVGRQVSFLPNNNRLIFTNRNSAFTLNDDYLFDFRDTSQILQTPNIWDDADRSYFWGDFVFSEPWTKDWNDIIMVGAKSDWNSLANASTGYVGVYNYALDAQCRVFGEAEGDQFGFHSAFMSSIPDPTDAIPGTVDIYPELMVGAPGKTVGSGKGSVYFIKYDSFNCMNDQYVYLNATGGPTYQGTTFLRIDADHPDIVAALGGAANEGFGKFVMPLPDLDGSGDGVAFAYIANTNSIVATSTVAPQYFIFKISYDTVSNTYATSLVKYETGESGSMLGGYAKIIDDINGDGIGEVAISHPGGIGRLGKTGQVRILSGAGIVTADEGDDLLQMLYNPDPNLSNFGISFEYGDITGDGLKDFVIGADRYDTSAYQDAGAIYVFPVEPIQN